MDATIERYKEILRKAQEKKDESSNFTYFKFGSGSFNYESTYEPRINADTVGDSRGKRLDFRKTRGC